MKAPNILFWQVLGQRQDRDELNAAYQAKLEENEKMAEERTAKKRKKRMKQKEKQKQKKKGNSKKEGLFHCIHFRHQICWCIYNLYYLYAQLIFTQVMLLISHYKANIKENNFRIVRAFP